MTTAGKKKVQPVTKPYLTGGVFDETTVKKALGFFGMLLIFALMAFLVSGMVVFGSRVFTIIFNTAVILILLFIAYNRGASLGTEAVARGEILYQRKEKGGEMTENERKLSFHPAKGFVIGLLGTLPFLILTAVFAIITRKQFSTIGVLPGFAANLAQRSEIGDALVTYTVPEPLGAADILRPIVRGILMPVFRMADTENKGLMLTLERLSPLMILLPGIAHGFGYLTGRGERTRVHTRIAESRKMRKRRENKERRERRENGSNRTPEKLN